MLQVVFRFIPNLSLIVTDSSDTHQRIPLVNLIALFLTLVAATIIVPVFKEAIKDRLGTDNFYVASFSSISMLGAFLFGPIAGYFSDRLRNRRSLILVFAFVDGLCFLSLAWIESTVLLLALRFIEGAVSIFVIGLLLAQLSDREHDPGQFRFFNKGILLGLGGMCIALGAGSGLGMGFVGQRFALLPFYVAAALMLLVGLLILIWNREGRIYIEKDIDLAHLKEALAQSHLLWIPFAYTFIDRFTAGFITTIFNLHLREDLALSAGMAGLAMALVLLPMGLLSYPAAMLVRRAGILPPVMVGSLIYGIGLALAGWLQEITGLYLSLAVCGLGAGIMFVPSLMLASSLAPPQLRAVVMSAYMGAGSLGFMLGPLVGAGLELGLESWLSKAQLLHIMGWLTLTFGLLEIVMVLFTVPFMRRLQQKSVYSPS